MGYMITGEGGFEPRINPLVTSSTDTVETTEVITGSVSVAGSTLLDDTFEADDGTDITAAGWTADGTDPGDVIEIDTAQYKTGASSCKYMGNGTTYYVYRTFTQQSSGVFSATFYMRYGTDYTGLNSQIWFCQAGYEDANCAAAFRLVGNDFEYRSGGSWVDVTGYTGVVANTWYKVKIDLDMDNNQYDITINDAGTPDVDNAAFQSNIDPLRVYLVSVGTPSYPVWLDDLCIE